MGGRASGITYRVTGIIPERSEKASLVCLARGEAACVGGELGPRPLRPSRIIYCAPGITRVSNISSARRNAACLILV